MALEILSKEYGVYKGGSFALASDLAKVFDWTSTTLDANQLNQTLTKYNDEGGSEYIRIGVQGEYDAYPFISASCVNGGVNYAAEAPNRVRFANIVKWADGFCFHGSSDALPNSSTGFVNFGVCKGTDITTDAVKWIAWIVNESMAFIASSNTVSSSGTDKQTFTSGKFTVASPLFSAYSAYTPNDILHICMTQEIAVNTAGYCVWNGRRYYKNGSILIPAE